MTEKHLINPPDTYNTCLLEPLSTGHDRLLVITGYTDPTFISEHLRELKRVIRRRTRMLQVDVLLGMVAKDGITERDHETLKTLVRDYEQQQVAFNLHYRLDGPPVHSKLFVWGSEGAPSTAWAGSANYTRAGFGPQGVTQEEILTPTDPERAASYAEPLFHSGIPCTSDLVYSRPIFRRRRFAPEELSQLDPTDSIPVTSSETAAQLSLKLYKSKTGETHDPGGGINWGLRDGRDPDEAYIHVPSDARPFFPPANHHFSVTTDDGEVLILSRASGGQAVGKDLRTPANNARLGRYLRKRIGAARGQVVLRKHLTSYGRDEVTFRRSSEGEYFLDFSPLR
ncbi:restriction endonuclease PLD domain-containing protein [Nesterenkonia cremea]|uniref:NgoFVII family restriction endonuclease n=1 Tax=Nesterenkonia cremea TaxID=1882340 RepID=A0A917AQB4_9MICC|nr:restriction endonuclease PLD domain-containing protein [Nesterenkonia cremea]GGE65006.1 NgoFVII family restriction endonuclease [Nesterenkonia cremea]